MVSDEHALRIIFCIIYIKHKPTLKLIQCVNYIQLKVRYMVSGRYRNLWLKLIQSFKEHCPAHIPIMFKNLTQLVLSTFI